MSQENVEVVRACYAALNAGDMDAAGELFAADAVMRMPQDWPEPGPFVGRDAVVRQLRRMGQTWDAAAVVPISDFIDAGDRVVVRFVWRATGRGPESNMEVSGIYTVRNGRVVEAEHLWDHADALEAVWLRE